ncbi:MAG: hypothetical protein ACFCVC_05885 [Acidimicrobiia bacterium]
MHRFAVLWAALLLALSVGLSISLTYGADAEVGDSEEKIVVGDGFEPFRTAEESVRQGIVRVAEWQMRSAVSGAVGALCGLAGFLLLVRSPTTKREALAGPPILLIPAFAWWVSPAVSVLSAWSGMLSLRWAIATPGIVVSTTLVAAGLVVRIVRAWRDPIEARPLTPRERSRIRALVVLGVLLVAMAALVIFQWRENVANEL